MAKPKKEEPAPAGRKGLELSDIQQFLSRFKVSGVNWNDFPPPPESKGAQLALAGAGGLTVLAGVGGILFGLLGLNGVFLSAGMALAGLGAAGTLYVLPDLGLYRRPLPNHPSSQPDDPRSLGETLMVTSAVVGFLNAGIGLILCAALYVLVHWSVALGGAVLLNVAGAYLGYLGDGENRRPILPEAPAPEPAGEDAAAT